MMRVRRGVAAGFRATSKWVGTVASIWIQCTSGSSYCFGIYSALLKSSQGYDQSTLDSVAFFKDVGANAGLLSGLLYSSASPPSPGDGVGGGCPGCGPWVVHAAGAAQCFAGYFMMWLAVTGAVPRPPVALMCLYMFLAAHAQTFFNTANVVTAVQNFPSNRGTAVGIMKGFLGLSGAILIQIYRTMFEGKPSNFLLMLALLPTILPLLLMFLVRVHPATSGDDKKLLDGFSLISLIVAGYLMVVIIWESTQSLDLAARLPMFVILLLLLASLLIVVLRGQLRDSTLLEASSHERIHLTADTKALDKGYEGAEAEKGRLEHDHVARSERSPGPPNHREIWLSRGENLNLLQAMRTLDFWLLFLAMACGMGSGLATVNNISQVGGSLGYTSVETSTLVSLWSIWNFLGRFGAGYVSDFFLRSRGFARPLFIAITLGTMTVGHAVIASGLPGSLYGGSVLVGVCYGCQWSLMPTITSEIFGIRHMGTIFNTVAVASPIGSYILSVRVVGYIYDTEASGKTTCTGTHCFMLSFLIMACVTALGSVASLGLFFRTRRFYKQVVSERLRCFTAP